MNCCTRTHSILNSAQLSNLKLLIIDEISMVDRRVLGEVQEELQAMLETQKNIVPTPRDIQAQISKLLKMEECVRIYLSSKQMPVTQHPPIKCFFYRIGTLIRGNQTGTAKACQAK